MYKAKQENWKTEKRDRMSTLALIATAVTCDSKMEL